MNVLELTDVTKTYASGELEVHALQGVSLTVRRGETVRYVASVQHAIANNGKTAAKAILVVEYSPGT